MKQTIELRLGQHLTMTPQLQQAIRLLQLSTLELQLEVQQALDSNLMLESVDDNNSDDEPQTSPEMEKADRDQVSDSELGNNEDNDDCAEEDAVVVWFELLPLPSLT